MTGALVAMVPVILLGTGNLPSDVLVHSRVREATSPKLVSVVCESTGVARKGYDTPPLTVLGSTFAKARQHSLWIISMRGNAATVMDGEGTVRRFLIKKRDPGFLLLVDAEKDPPMQVITIDPRNASFTYVMRNVAQTSNREHALVGQCRSPGP